MICDVGGCMTCDVEGCVTCDIGGFVTCNVGGFVACDVEECVTCDVECDGFSGMLTSACPSGYMGGIYGTDCGGNICGIA